MTGSSQLLTAWMKAKQGVSLKSCRWVGDTWGGCEHKQKFAKNMSYSTYSL
jgi:hypothetical protein